MRRNAGFVFVLFHAGVLLTTSGNYPAIFDPA
jgi:hypothetical protein